MMKLLLATLMLVAMAAPASAGQEFPSCDRLSKLWTERFYGLLKPDWAKRALRCDLLDAGRFSDLSRKEEIDITVARAAYMLDKTEWARTSPAFGRALVSYGGISGPPSSMLEWVAERTTGIIYSREVQGAYRSGENGRIYLGGGNFTSKAIASGLDGINLASQLVHEARHANEPHVKCPGETGDTSSCDTTITEEFYGGGAHGVAALWCAWIANYSTWPYAYRQAAQATALNVMGPKWAKINDHASADLWTCRYFKTPVWSKKCR